MHYILKDLSTANTITFVCLWVYANTYFKIYLNAFMLITSVLGNLSVYDDEAKQHIYWHMSNKDITIYYFY